MTLTEWLQTAALIVLAVAIAWALGIWLEPTGYAWPAAAAALAIQWLAIAALLQRTKGV